ncbi:MAG: SAM-dependent methyltransferase, partial [Alphaproteobacteria bacterium]|nr:SAM-dependent methyltransferase [Alphaproteobacteria bacterium]
LGILHYHRDIARFFEVMRAITRPGGTMLINEFHPVQRKLFGTLEPRDYFNTALTEGDVPNPTGDGRTLGKCTLRFWTLGEIVTAVIGAGFRVERLDEHPDWTDAKIPGTFTLVARVPSGETS